MDFFRAFFQNKVKLRNNNNRHLVLKNTFQQ